MRSPWTRCWSRLLKSIPSTLSLPANNVRSLRNPPRPHAIHLQPRLSTLQKQVRLTTPPLEPEERGTGRDTPSPHSHSHSQERRGATAPVTPSTLVRKIVPLTCLCRFGNYEILVALRATVAMTVDLLLLFAPPPHRRCCMPPPPSHKIYSRVGLRHVQHW